MIEAFAVVTSKRHLAIALTLAGMMYGLFLGFLGFLMTGAGHGWLSGLWSGLAVFILPLFGIVLVFRDHALGRRLLAFVIVGMLGVDGFLVYTAWDEGREYLFRLWSAPGGLLLWLFWLSLWIGWQGAVLVVTLLGRKRERPAA